MSFFPIKFKIIGLLLLTISLTGIGLLNLRDRANGGSPYDGAWWEETTKGVEAAAIEPGTPANASGLKAGDRLVQIDGQPVRNLKDYTQAIYNLEAGARVAYVIRRGESPETHAVSVTIARKSLLAMVDFYRILVAFTYLGIGLYIFASRWRAERAIHFYLVCLFSFVLYLFHYTPKLDPLDYVVYWSSSLALLLLPAVFLHFTLHFPAKKAWVVRSHTWTYLVYVPFALLLMLHIRWFAGKLAFMGLARDLQTRILIDRIHITYYVLFFVLGTLALAHTSWTAKSAVLKQQMKWITRGAAVGIAPFALFYALPYALGVRTNPYMEASLLSLAFIPLAFSYAILKYKLMDVDVLFKKGAIYVLASSSILIIYFLLILLGSQVGKWLAPELETVSIAIAALVAAFLFGSIRNRIQARIDRLFYKEKYNYRQSLTDFGKTLSADISLARLTRQIVERVSKTFDVRPVALFLKDEFRDDFYKLTEATDPSLSTNGDYLFIPKEMFGLQFADYKLPIREEITQSGLCYFQPLKVGGKVVGVLGLGRKTDGGFLSSEDIELLEVMSGYAAVAVENAHLYKSVEAKAYEYAQLKAYSENIIESINIGVIVLDLDGRATGCNSAFEALYGMRRDDIIDRKLEELFSYDFVQSLRKAGGRDSWSFNETVNIYKLFLDTRKGTNLIVNVSMTPLMDKANVITGTLIVFDDITERVRLEDQLLQAEKLSSIGLLAAGIAHEINTPIAGISSYTQMLLKQTQDSDPKKDLLAKIEKQTVRASAITNSLLNFSRLSGSEFKPLNLNDLINETFALLEHQFKNTRIRVVTRLDEGLAQIKGNAGKLQQVFINLLLNAKDAMPGGGELKITTSQSDALVVVDIEDTGVGISKENIKRIYDPFFTTKGGKGTGLGLAVSYGIIQEHAGRIFVESAPGQGTHFRLKFPASVSG
jgi:PAS domain S-box-containing protein